MRRSLTFATVLGLLAGLLSVVTPTPSPASAQESTCFGYHETQIEDAKDSYSETCGVTYSDVSGLHKCVWSPDGWRCEGPGESRAADPDQPPEQDPPQAEEPGFDFGVTPTDNAIVVNTLRELRDADLPTWAKEDTLIDFGRVDPNQRNRPEFDWGALSDSDLDKPFDEPASFDPTQVAASQAAAGTIITPRGLFNCGGRWKNKSKTIEFNVIRGEGNMDLPPATKNLGNGFSADFSSGAKIDGSLEMKAVIKYRERSNRCIGVPYRWEFTSTDIDMIAELDGALEVENTLTLRYKDRLWQHDVQIGPKIEKSVPIASIFTIDFAAHLNLRLALDLEAALSITQQTKINQDYDLRGYYESYLTCTSNGCDQRESGVSTVNFDAVERPGTSTQTTLDITLTPSAELQLLLDIDVSLLSLVGIDVFDGKVAIVAALPVRLYWTQGNACSDADADGVNEEVSGTIVDITAHLGAYIEGRIGGQRAKDWISLKVPNGWVRGQLNDALDVREPAPSIRRNLAMKVLRTGNSSPLEPVVLNAGLFQAGNGVFEGIELDGVRDCYPFKDDLPATVDVNWGDGQTTRHSMTNSTRIAHNWADNGRGRTVAVRIVKDDIGRAISGPWVRVEIGPDSQIEPPAMVTPTLVLSGDTNGPTLEWGNIDRADGFNIYRDGNYATTVRGVTSWSLANEDGEEHSYTIVAFDQPSPGYETYTGRSNPVIYGGPRFGDRPTAVVSMGDSFISGEGGRWLGNAKTARDAAAGTDRGRASYLGESRPNECHRSDTAMVQSAEIKYVVPLNIACSGAKTQHVRNTDFKGEAPQTEQLSALTANYDVEMIVLSIGGNDLGFGDILTDCASDYALGGSPCRHDNIYGQIQNDVIPKVRDTINDIKGTMARAGDHHYRFVLQSYPSPLPRAAQMKYDSGTIHLGDDRMANGCGFYNKDLDWARDTVVPLLDYFYQRLAGELGIEFLSLRNSMSGKEVCADGTSHASTTQAVTAPGMEGKLEWFRWGNVNSLVQGDAEEMLHPNALGQEALGRCLNLVWARNGESGHRCERGGSTPSEMWVGDLS